MEAPRSVPNYDRKQVAGTWWYCLHCRHALAQESSIQAHVRSVHEEPEGTKGEDYTNGIHLRVMMQRWDEWSLLAVDRFALSLDSLRGAEDLLVDIGEGLPE